MGDGWRLGVGVSFNLGRAVLLNNLMVAGLEKCGTFHLTQIKVMTHVVDEFL